MSHEISTRILLRELADGSPDDELTFDLILDSFRHRSYGLFLLIVLIPVFIPIPAGQGGFSGLLIAMIGAQMAPGFSGSRVPTCCSSGTSDSESPWL